MDAILYDGWPLVFAPDGAAAMHLHTLIQACPANIVPIVALPGETRLELPERVEQVIRARRDTPGDRLGWEQRDLPGLARGRGAAAIHATRRTGSLLGDVPWLVSPSESGSSRPAGGIVARLQSALAAGGYTRARSVLWPEDLRDAAHADQDQVVFLPPVVDPANFSETLLGDVPDSVDLPETYVLYDGPAKRADLRRVLDAWSWAAGPVGEYYPLVMVNMPADGRAQVESYCADLNLGDTVRLVSGVTARGLGALYRGAALLLFPVPASPWGSPIRRALAAGKPVVGIEERTTSAMLGPAGYLIAPDDLRGLGAAVITVIVEEQVAESLSKAASRRASEWQDRAFAARLEQIYLELLR